MKKLTQASKDLITLFCAALAVFLISYYGNVFLFLVDFFQKKPAALAWIDEILTVLVTFGIGLTVFAWRRWREVKKESAARIKAQEELLRIAETKAETEQIISKQLHCDIEEFKKIEREVIFRRSQSQEKK